MKYLAAYALLTLGGKKDISTSHLTQPPQTWRLFSAVSSLTLLMPKSIKLSQLLRGNLFTNSSLRDKADSETVLHLLAKLPKRRKSRRKSLKRKSRNKSPRRKPHQPPKKKTQISEISSDDTHPHIYSKSNIISPKE